MAFQDLPWHPNQTSAYVQTGGLPVEATARAHGAMRYRCPVTGCFVLITDENTLQWLARPHARLRCADCGELHAIGSEADAPAAL
jgi:hypothetical protein